MAEQRKAGSADEFNQQQAGDEAHQASLAEQRERLAALAAACAADERDLLRDLRDVGVRVDSVWDFVATGGAPPVAVPILVSHLSVAHHERIWEGIIRALSVKHARAHAFNALASLYRSETDQHRRQFLAHAIGSMADLDDVQDLPDFEHYRALFRQSRKPEHPGPAV